MTTIKLHNTKSRKKEDFVPIKKEDVRMYVCGPTVYDRAHIGNARPVVVFDVLYRLLREVYGADHVTYVRNFTDVDDKINATAQARKEAGAAGTLEELVRERTEETIDWYLKDMGALGAMQPNHMPRATQYIAQMIAMNEDLIAKGHAYAAEGHVLFAVDSWKEQYGKLSGRSVDDMIAGARVEVAPYKRNPMDFVLWKPSTDEQPGWESPWGRGRPGWHIECSAMAKELLGVNFDIHGGGNDLMFPHHENEIAQSCCADPEGGFANYWLHNEMLQVEGKKMSKSLGNFFTVRDLLEDDIPGEVIRYVFLSTHYRKPMDWTEKKAKEARLSLEKFYSVLMLPGLYIKPEDRHQYLDTNVYKPDDEIVAALADDLNTAKAITRLHAMLKLAKDGEIVDSQRFVGSLVLLGLLGEDTDIDTLSGLGGVPSDLDKSFFAEEIEEWMVLRGNLKSRAKDFMKAGDKEKGGLFFKWADAMRDDDLPYFGFEVKDTKDGYEWELTSKLRSVGETRINAGNTEKTVTQKDRWDETLDRMKTFRANLKKQIAELTT